jgi:hypothetical protein
MIGVVQRLWKYLPSALLLLTAVCVFTPLSPRMPSALDSSWCFGMNQAIAQGLSIGREIVFSFGPYAYIYTGTYHPATDGSMLWGCAYIGLSFGVVAIQVFRKPVAQLALLVIISAAMPLRDALFFFYPTLVAVWVVRENWDENSGRKLALLAALLFPFGLLVLIKVSTVAVCGGALVIVFARFALERKWRKTAIVLVFPLSIITFWCLAGQPVPGLSTYFETMSLIVSGFTEAMSSNGRSKEIVCYAVAAVALLGMIFFTADRRLVIKSLLAAMLGMALFLSFKAGFVRHDGHATTAASFLLLTGLLVAVLSSSVPVRLGSVLCGVLVWLYIVPAYVGTSPATLIEKVANTYSSAWHGAYQRIAKGEMLTERYQEAMTQIMKAYGTLGVLSGTTDIYSFDQSYLIASGNTWNPRPVFQSYSAYTPALIERNRTHLLGEHAPDNLVFKVQPIDGRLPSLEDGASWTEIVRYYEPTGFSGDFLLLKRSGRRQAYSDEFLGEKTVSLGEVVTLPDIECPVFMRVSIRKSWFGELINILYKPSQLRIELKLTDGAIRDYRFVAGMGQTDFLVSPLIENTEEFGLLFDTGFLDGKKVQSFVIDAVSKSPHPPPPPPRKSGNQSTKLNSLENNFQSTRTFLTC